MRTWVEALANVYCEVGGDMGRIRLELPQKFDFSTEIPVRFSDLNAGAHLAHEKVLQLAEEARLAFIRQLGFADMSIDGTRFAVSDAAVVYKSQAFYGQVLRIDIAVRDCGRKTCDFFHLITHTATRREVARVKVGIVFLDYETQRMTNVPASFRAMFSS